MNMINNILYENYLIGDDRDYEDALSWIKGLQASSPAEVNPIDLNSVLDGDWFVKDNGDISHQSGGFFSIIGVNVVTDQRESGKGWKQPMVDQGTESSIAGFIVRIIDSEVYCLAEAKFEPGNYGKVLISPSLQVTYSNLFQAHGGRKPKFCEFFDGTIKDVNVHYSRWMPEDGGRFYLKRIKYMLVEIMCEEDLEISDNYRWLKVKTLKRLLHIDNMVNPHVRSLLAIF